MPEILNIDGREVILDERNLVVNEANITEYLKTEAGYYNNFGSALAEAESQLATQEMEYDKVYGEKFNYIKSTDGGSDKLVEGRTLSDIDVLMAKGHVIAAKENVRKILWHLKAWDKSHENVLNMGYMLRKEMDKIGGSHIMKHNDPDEITKFVTQEGL
jgi:hypothetical protein